MYISKHQYSPRPRPWGKAFQPDLKLSTFDELGLHTMRVQDRRRAFVAGNERLVDHNLVSVSTTNSEGWEWRGHTFDVGPLLNDPAKSIQDMAIDAKYHGDHSAIAMVFREVPLGTDLFEDAMYSFHSDNEGASWTRKYRFTPSDFGYPPVPIGSGDTGGWFISGKRTFPTASGVIDVFGAVREQDFLSGPLSGQRWHVEHRLFVFKNGILHQDIELPIDPVQPGILFDRDLLPVGAWSPRYNSGFFAVEKNDPLGTTSGEEWIYKVTSDGVEQVAQMPAGDEGEGYLEAISGILWKPEINALHLTRFGGDLYTSFNNMQSSTRKTLDFNVDLQGGQVQRKMDVLINDLQSLSSLLGEDLLDLNTNYLTPMAGILGDQRDSTRSWRRQARGLSFSSGDDTIYDRRLY